ncbi:probable plastid-lipid-associated protein 11, chloroplastic isoform X4 [Amaranthus tricolor]|uniref:probable plastid-lipid-associated protein 11, chloroplastic isoform X4 n=1 Tax=Amaranthus tricolor TaxID=29722 RepID=UPI002589C8B5|nr:probable plastid-lipid-associated protein 11, chloroplastic isoform X4 [Amaranthus tricolor]
MAKILLFGANSQPLSSSKPFIRPKSIPNPSILSRISKFSVSSSSQSQSLSGKTHLLNLISDQDRGLKTQQNPKSRLQIIDAIESLAVIGKDLITTDNTLSGTWRMLWTTEKEQLFIIKNATIFGTQVGDVLQVIDVDSLKLNNVITFPPSGVFFVRSSMEVASAQRVNFRFTSAVLRGKHWEFPLPPFGQGWFESIYLDDDIRVAKDIRGDYLVVERAPYQWKE